MPTSDSTGHKRIEVLLRQAAQLYRDNRFKDTVEIWKEICEIEPDNPYWLHNLALALLYSERLDECLPLFAHLLQIAPELSRVHNNFAMAALRLGVSFSGVAHFFIQALMLSKDEGEFYRHLMNSVNSIVYGFEDRTEAEAALDRLTECVVQFLEHNSEAEYRKTNQEELTRLINIYRHIARFRSCFGHTEWAAAAEELNTAKHGFSKLGLENFVQGIARIEAIFKLARDISSYVEAIGNGFYEHPGSALATCIDLQEQFKRQSYSHPDKYPVLFRLQTLLFTFLDGTSIALQYLDGRSASHEGIEDKCSVIQMLSADYFRDIGQDLLTALRSMNKACSGIAAAIIRRANPDLINNDRHAAWRRICLLLNGLHLDFRAVDVALARGQLGWVYDPKKESIRVVQGFKAFIERQAWHDHYVNGAPQENIERALLQAYLLPRNYREVPVRGGRSDVLMFEMDGRLVFETKIWRGQANFNSGLSEIAEYIQGEGDDGLLTCAFYIVLDPTVTARAAAYISRDEVSSRLKEGNIEVVVVHIKPPQPSAKA